MPAPVVPSARRLARRRWARRCSPNGSSARHEIGRSDHTTRAVPRRARAPRRPPGRRVAPSSSTSIRSAARHEARCARTRHARGPLTRIVHASGLAFASPFVWNAVTSPRRSMSWIRCMTRACSATGGVNKRTSPTRRSPRGTGSAITSAPCGIAGDIEPDSTGASRKRCVAVPTTTAPSPRSAIAITAIAAPCATRRATARIVNEGPPSRRCLRAVPAVDSTGRRRAPVLVGWMFATAVRPPAAWR